MSFALEADEQVLAAVRRMALEQIDMALHHLEEPYEDLNMSVHAARQSLKRIRALLILARDALGDRVFKQEWNCYRAAGRLLAPGRDAAVVVETFDALVRRFSSVLPEDEVALQRRELVDRRDNRLRTMLEDEGALIKVAEMLTSARERVAVWRARREGFKALRKGLSRSYRAGRQGLRMVRRNPTPTNFHAWRRPVKVLWHELQILNPVWPTILQAYAEVLHELSDRLNSNHDLDVLRQTLRSSEDQQKKHGCESLFVLIERRCRELEAEALPLGRLVYTEPPGRFTKRLEQYWTTWQELSSKESVALDVTSAMIDPLVAPLGEIASTGS